MMQDLGNCFDCKYRLELAYQHPCDECSVINIEGVKSFYKPEIKIANTTDED